METLCALLDGALGISPVTSYSGVKTCMASAIYIYIEREREICAVVSRK